MKQIKDILIFSVRLFIALIAISCIEREELEISESEYISFVADLYENNLPKVKSLGSNISVEVQNWDLTLSTKVDVTTALDGYAKVIGFQYPRNFSEALFPWEDISTKDFEFNGDELKTADPIRWGQINEDNERLKLFVYSPIDIPGATLPDIYKSGVPKITYILPPDRKDHKDIIAAVKEVPTKTADGEPFNQTIALTFTHALTALKFRMGFECTVKSIQIMDVYNQADYILGEGWANYKYFTDKDNNGIFNLDFGVNGKHFSKNEMIFRDQEVLMMIPQSFHTSELNPRICVTLSDNTVISASLKSQNWEEGKLITYTLYRTQPFDYIYFDLNAGGVSIDNHTYTGYVYKNEGTEIATVHGNHDVNNKYYVYQSSNLNDNYKRTGWNGEPGADGSIFTVPSYESVTYNQNGKSVLWSEFITNNTSVEDVIEIWDDGSNIRDDKQSAPDERHIGTHVVRDVGRTHTKNFINITGTNTRYDLTIDNVYSVIQEKVTSSQMFRYRSKGGIAYSPKGGTSLTVNFVGDNRMGCLHINNKSTDTISLQGTGTLTVADADFLTLSDVGQYDPKTLTFGDDKGYVSNFWNSAIGNNTDAAAEKVYNLYIKGGIIFAGTTKTEDCTAIGGGGNGLGQVYIQGGIVTAVATTAGTAIGGGMGHSANGGPGEVFISGGNIYAYNFANKWGISSSAIGGGGSSASIGSSGKVEISGGNVYSYSALGTGIGGGSSLANVGGDASIKITGGYIIAKSGNANGIGGGNGGTNSNTNGGTANIEISGSPIIRTGSIGGGKTLSTTGNIGSANIKISGGDIQAQFVMAAGAASAPVFLMEGGVIRNSYTNDSEFNPVQSKGGAVYMEDGHFTMTGGIIHNCLAESGGAIYIKESTQASQTAFTMTGGYIQDCISTTHGGAVYIEGGAVTLKGGEISNNIAQQGNGGGIFIRGGNFIMTHGSKAVIKDNAAFSRTEFDYGKGGGIYITSDSGNVQVDILSGSITGNTSDRRGGGVAVELGSQNASSTVIVGTLGNNTIPNINNNSSSLSGGGLYVVGQNANIIINGGEIIDNVTSGYEANNDVANEQGLVTLNGGNVKSVTVTYDANGGYVGTDQQVTTATQKIVISTNSKMVLPDTFSRLGWTLKGWHTRKDGDNTKGKFYPTGAVLNLNANLTLYAQWQENR